MGTRYECALVAEGVGGREVSKTRKYILNLVLKDKLYEYTEGVYGGCFYTSSNGWSCEALSAISEAFPSIIFTVIWFRIGDMSFEASDEYPAAGMSVVFEGEVFSANASLSFSFSESDSGRLKKLKQKVVSLEDFGGGE